VYTDSERHDAQRYRRTDRQTDDIMMPIADHTVRAAVRSAKLFHVEQKVGVVSENIQKDTLMMSKGVRVENGVE